MSPLAAAQAPQDRTRGWLRAWSLAAQGIFPRVKIAVLTLAFVVGFAPQAAASTSDMDVIAGSSGRRPGVFLVHGGWWSEGDKRTLTPIARRYADLGYAVFNVNYRLSGTATWPAQRDDVLDAIADARAHAARYRFDPARYVIVGFSAGGHLAVSVGAYGPRPPGLRGVVGLSPVTSPKTAYLSRVTDALATRLRTSAIALAGCLPARCPRTWSSMEPVEQWGSGDAPALLLHSAHEFVPPSHSLPLQGADVRVLSGSAHSTTLYGRPSVARTVERWISAALG